MRDRRTRVAKGIYSDRHGLSATVKIGKHQREKRWPSGTSLRELRTWQDRTRVELRQRHPQTARGLFAHDADRYLDQMGHLASFATRRCDIRAWVDRLGSIRRSQITAEHVRLAVAHWSKAGLAPKTCNDRVRVLAHLYRILDGAKAPTPCDEVTFLRVPRTVPIAVSPTLITAVEAKLREHEAKGWLGTSKTRARFMVLASTGKRPSELKRARPEDIDLKRRVWIVRDGKGGFSPGVYLNEDMLTAWRLFIAAEAWGWFDTRNLDRRLYKAGWPRGVRVYNLRHSVGLALSEQGEDLADIQAHMGHRSIATTRHFYVPVLGSRLQSASEKLDGRLGWGKLEMASVPVKRTPKRLTGHRSA